MFPWGQRLHESWLEIILNLLQHYLLIKAKGKGKGKDGIISGKRGFVFSFGAAGGGPGLAQVVSSRSMGARPRRRKAYLAKPSVWTALCLHDTCHVEEVCWRPSFLSQDAWVEALSSLYSQMVTTTRTTKGWQRSPMSTRGCGPPAESRVELFWWKWVDLFFRNPGCVWAAQLLFIPRRWPSV